MYFLTTYSLSMKKEYYYIKHVLNFGFHLSEPLNVGVKETNKSEIICQSNVHVYFVNTHRITSQEVAFLCTVDINFTIIRTRAEYVTILKNRTG